MQGCEPIRGTRCATERGRVEHAPMDEICSRSAGRVLKPASQSLVRRKSSSTRSPLLAFLGLSLENLESRAIGPDVLACALAGARGLGRPRAAIAIAHSLTRSLAHSLAHSLTRSHTHPLSVCLTHTPLPIRSMSTDPETILRLSISKAYNKTDLLGQSVQATPHPHAPEHRILGGGG